MKKEPKKLEHDWERIPEMPLLERCKRCGWGWKVFENNDLPCPGKMVTDIPQGKPA